MEEESNGELDFFETLLKRNNGKSSVLLCRKRTYTDQYLHNSCHHQTSCKESSASWAYSNITDKDDITKENARMKQVLKENRY